MSTISSVDKEAVKFWLKWRKWLFNKPADFQTDCPAPTRVFAFEYLALRGPNSLSYRPYTSIEGSSVKNITYCYITECRLKTSIANTSKLSELSESSALQVLIKNLCQISREMPTSIFQPLYITADVNFID